MNSSRRIHLLLRLPLWAERLFGHSRGRSVLLAICLLLLLAQQRHHTTFLPFPLSEDQIHMSLRKNPYDLCYPDLQQTLLAHSSGDDLAPLLSSRPYDASVVFHSFLEKSLRFQYYAEWDSAAIYARLAARLADFFAQAQSDSFFLRRQKHLQEHVQDDPRHLRQWLLANAFFVHSLNLEITDGELKRRCFAYARAQFQRLGDEKKVTDIYWLSHFYRDRQGERATELQLAISRWLALSQSIGYRDGELEAYLARAEKYGEVGQSDSALVYYARAEHLSERIGKAITFAHVLHGQVQEAMQRGDLKHAESLAQRGLRFSREHGFRYVAADLMEQQALIHHLKQEYRAAMDTLSAAIALHREVAEHLDLPPLFLLQAKMFFDLNDCEAALVAADSALRHYHTLRDHAGLARTHGLMGLIHARIKNWKAARDNEHLGLKHLTRADTLVEVIELWNLFGDLRMQFGDTLSARMAYVRALHLSRARGFVLGQAKAHLGLGEIAWRQAQWDTAQFYLEQALGYAKDMNLREVLWQCHYSLAQFYESCDQNEQARNHYLLSVRELEAIRDNIARLEFNLSYFSGVQGVFERAIAFAVDDLKDAKLALRLMEQSRARNLLARLQNDASEEPFDVERLRNTFDDSTAALAYRITPEGCYGVFVHRGELTAQRLPITRAQLAQTVKRLRAVLGIEQREVFARRLRQEQPRLIAETEEVCAEIYQHVLAPFAAQLPGVRDLYIVPDGPLHYLPFAALLPKAGGPFLGETLVLASAPSLSVLKLLREQKPRFESERLQRALVLAVQSKTIPNAVLEACEVARIITGTKEQIYDRLTRAEMAALLEQRFGLIHLALHADVNDAVPFRSYLLLEEERNAIHRTDFNLFAALRKVIAAPVASPLRQERLFLVSDLMPLNLKHSELIVLSACNTALGQEINGEGMLGLTQGFLCAGAARLLTSLWEVDDQRTFELMKYFYEELISIKQAPGRALRTAQIRLLRDLRKQYPGYPFPYFWAAFVLTGPIS